MQNNIQEKKTMTRIRLNQEYRNKIANRMRVHLEQEDTVEKQNYDNLKGDQIDINDKAWKVAEQIVRRHYTNEDVEKAYYLQINLKMLTLSQKIVVFTFIIWVKLKVEIMMTNLLWNKKLLKNILTLD